MNEKFYLFLSYLQDGRQLEKLTALFSRKGHLAQIWAERAQNGP